MQVNISEEAINETNKEITRRIFRYGRKEYQYSRQK